MKRRRLMIYLVLGVVLTLTLLMLPNRDTNKFDFSLRYNVDGKDFVSTFENLLTQDTVEGIKTVDFKFKQKDLKKIKDKIDELGIMDEDFNGLPRSDFNHNTIGLYRLKIRLNGQTKSIFWTSSNVRMNMDFEVIEEIGSDEDDKTVNKVTLIKVKNDEDDRYEGEYGRANKLFELKNFIIDIIYDYEEFKEIPQHKLYL